LEENILAENSNGEVTVQLKEEANYIGISDDAFERHKKTPTTRKKHSVYAGLRRF